MILLRLAVAVTLKDLRIELRSRHAVGVVLPFAGTLLIAFGVSLGPGRTLLEETAPGLLWLAVLFASVLAFRGAYESEGEDNALEGLRLAPVDRAAIYLGKAAAVAFQLVVLELAIILLVTVLFGVTVATDPIPLIAAFLLGTVGLAAVGNLFGILAESARAREAVFPLLVLPVTIPILIAGVRAVMLAQAGRGSEASPWLSLLVVFDLVYLSLGILLFDHLVED